MPQAKRDRKEPEDTDWIAELYSRDYGSVDGFQLEKDSSTHSTVECSHRACSGCQSSACLDNAGSLLQAFDDLPLPSLEELLQLPLSEDILFGETSLSETSTVDRPRRGDGSQAACNESPESPALSSSDSYVKVKGNVTASSSSSLVGEPAYGSSEVGSAVQSRQASPQPEPPANGDKAPDGPEAPATSHHSCDSKHGGGLTGNGSEGSDSQLPIAEEEKKRHARMLRNRESAHLSRQRKKMQLDEKERRCQELQSQNLHLTGLVSHLTSENAALRHHLAAACQKAGQPVPALLTPPAPAQPMMYSYPYGYPTLAAAPGPSQYAYVGGVPKLPIQKLKASRPAPCDLTNTDKDQESQNNSKDTPPRKRRRKTIAGGGTILAAFFCFLVFCGPEMPGFSRRINTDSSGGNPFTVAPIHFRALPASAGSGSGHAGVGRVLQSVELEANTTGQENGDFWSDTSGKQTWGSLLLQHNDQATEMLALQHLKEIAPVAVFSKMDGSNGKYSPPSPWKGFAALADSVLSPDGLASPAVCKEVFSFDASSVQDPKLARAQLQQYLATLNTFKGRSLKALPLPPIGGNSPQIEQDEVPFARTTIGCSDDTDMIISVMLPTKDNGGEPDSFTTLDKLYVVVLKPNKKYMTYACGLQSPILV